MKGKMSLSDAGRLGALKVNEGLKRRAADRRSEYLLNPVRCAKKGCDNPIPYFKRNTQKYCSHPCATSIANKGVRRNGSEPGNCLWCEKRLPLSKRKFCNVGCQHKYAHKMYVQKWMDDEISGLTNHGLAVSNHVKTWMRETYGNTCSICKGTEWMGEPMPLVVDHIDGNHKHNRPENLRFVCGNCGMLLPTFAGRNRGRGRQARKTWDDKKSKVPV